MSPHRGARKFYLPGNCAEDLGAGRRAERGQVEIDHRANTHKKKEITFCGGVGFKHEASSKRFQEAMIVSVAVCLARERVPPLATPPLFLSLPLSRARSRNCQTDKAGNGSPGTRQPYETNAWDATLVEGTDELLNLASKSVRTEGNNVETKKTRKQLRRQSTPICWICRVSLMGPPSVTDALGRQSAVHGKG